MLKNIGLIKFLFIEITFVIVSINTFIILNNHIMDKSITYINKNLCLHFKKKLIILRFFVQLCCTINVCLVFLFFIFLMCNIKKLIFKMFIVYFLNQPGQCLMYIQKHNLSHNCNILHTNTIHS